MKTSYFTFGQCHSHVFDSTRLDKDCVLKITAENPRNVMIALFGAKWAFEYTKKPDMSLYPRGLYILTVQWL